MLPKPPNGYLDRSTADSRLGRFVLGERADGPTRLPKRAEPAHVDDFIRKLFDGGKPTTRQLSQAYRLLRFFDLRARSAQVPKWLDRSESTEPDVLRSLISIAVLGDLGDDALQQQAAGYFGVLAARRPAEPLYEHFVPAFFHLPVKADPQGIREPLDKKMKSLKPDIERNDDALVAYEKLKDLQEDRLPRILKAKQRRHEVEQLKDARRRQELARGYLGLEEYADVDWRGWCAMWLQRDCNATSPDELASVFIELLDRMMTSPVSGPTGPVTPADLKRYVTSCARAAQFYQGQLTDAQTEFVARHNVPDQSDLLYWEPE
jgi:hypothetical protein